MYNEFEPVYYEMAEGKHEKGESDCDCEYHKPAPEKCKDKEVCVKTCFNKEYVKCYECVYVCRRKVFQPKMKRHCGNPCCRKPEPCCCNCCNSCEDAE